MQNKTLSGFDFSQQGASSRLYSKLPLLTSHAANWNGMYLEHHHQALRKKPESYSLQHLIVIRKTTPEFSGRIIDGRPNYQQVVAGDIAIVPAKVPYQAWHAQSECVVICLEPTQFSHTVYESIDPDRVELMPLLPKPDPLIYQIGLALTTELASNGAGSRLYAEAMATALSVHLFKHNSKG
jgi:AraC family transcriptional regulator